MNEIIPMKNERILEKSDRWVFGIIGRVSSTVLSGRRMKSVIGAMWPPPTSSDTSLFPSA